MINGNPRARFETGLLAAGLLLLIAVCWICYGILTDPSAMPEPTAVALEQPAYQLAVGDQLTLRVKVTPIRATSRGEDNWSSSDPQVVAVYPSGIIVAESVGSAVVTVTRGQLTDSCQVTVVPGR